MHSCSFSMEVQSSPYLRFFSYTLGTIGIVSLTGGVYKLLVEQELIKCKVYGYRIDTLSNSNITMKNSSPGKEASASNLLQSMSITESPCLDTVKIQRGLSQNLLNSSLLIGSGFCSLLLGRYFYNGNQ